jgi:hypothetical protein
MGQKPASRYANHPMIKYVRSLPGEFYLAREVAQMVGCSPRMLAYINKHSPTPMGATHQAQYGGTALHLYTPERVEEIREYLRARVTKADQGYRQKGPAVMWTHTEAAQRRRERDRARHYRRKAAQYRATDREKDALRMDRTADAITARLDKEKLARWQKVHGVKKRRAK